MHYKIERYNFKDQFSEEVYKEILDKILATIKNGNYILSEEVEDFETNFALSHNSKYAISCNSGTDSLILALMALGISSGDEVIIPANTFYSTALAICRTGATPVLVDVGLSSFLIDTNLIESKITNRTKAIIAVHLYGLPCNMNLIVSICQKHNIQLIEDCAQAHGAKFENKYVGNFGVMGCFSMHPSKNLPAAGDAGVITTNSFDLSEKLKMLRHLGQKKQNEHLILGINSRLDTIQAIVLNYRLPKLTEWNNKRREIAGIYKDSLKDYPISFQEFDYDADHVYHLFQINCGSERDRLLTFLRHSGIDAVVRYPVPIHKQSAFSFLKESTEHIKNSEFLSKSLICLPLHPLITKTEVNYILEIINNYYENGK